jgi:hypothetical protein
MIKDVPGKEDFDAIGIALLDQSWETAASLLVELEEAKRLIDPEDEEIYWKSASTKLATALAIAHQGAEFLLKGRIAAVSPLLLIANPPREWPKPEADGNIPFSQFRTVDAQDIVRLHDGCAEAPLDRDFASAFETLRIRRNSVMHSVNRDLKVHAAGLIEEILKIYSSLMPDRNWVDARRDSLFDSSTSQLWSCDWVEPSIVREFNVIKDSLSPAVVLRYFGFDKDRRAYLCPNCTFYVSRDDGYESYSAMLTEKVSGCTTLHCFICHETQEVQRVDCGKDDCRGNVIDYEY